jgi:glycosyltransferase involved in cell wall biosynthesis
MIPGQVNIIIPLFNQEAYIRQCVESCLTQTYKNFTITIVNDGSTDASRRVVQEVIDDYMREDNDKREPCMKAVEEKGLEYEKRRQEIWIKYFADSPRRPSEEGVGYTKEDGIRRAG